MTIWTPDISGREGPKYQTLAGAIAQAIASGELTEGERLPTHRDLAWRLGITVGTITRAYALAQAQGHITGEVGRGTYVLPERDRLAVPAREAVFDFPMTAFGIGGVQQADTDSEKSSGPIVMNQNFPADPWGKRTAGANPAAPGQPPAPEHHRRVPSRQRAKAAPHRGP